MGQHTGERNTITNPTTDNPTTTTKKQQLEIVEIYRYLKRHQGRFKGERGQTPIYKSSICGLRGRTNCLKTLIKAQ